MIPSICQDSMVLTTAWAEISRLHYLQDGLRYVSDTTNDGWALIGPFMPEPRRLARPRKTSPTAVVIDSQPVKTTESGGPRRLDAGKETNGGKRHIVTDTEGHTVGLQVHPADIQGRDGPVKSAVA